MGDQTRKQQSGKCAANTFGATLRNKRTFAARSQILFEIELQYELRKRILLLPA